MRDFLSGIHYNSWILPALLIIPLVGAVLLWIQRAASGVDEADVKVEPARQIALWTLTIEFIVSCGLWWSFVPGIAGWQGLSGAQDADEIEYYLIMILNHMTSLGVRQAKLRLLAATKRVR